MVTLVDGIAGVDNTGKEVTKLSVHSLSSAFWFLRKGEITKANIISKFNLDAEAQAQLDKIVTFYQGLSADEQSEFRDRFESSGILLETGLITKAQFISLLGI